MVWAELQQGAQIADHYVNRMCKLQLPTHDP
jgi:hypothetical protein